MIRKSGHPPEILEHAMGGVPLRMMFDAKHIPQGWLCSRIDNAPKYTAKARWDSMSNANIMDIANKPTVLICINCKGQAASSAEGEPLAGARLAEAVAAAADPSQIKVLSIRCLANCSRGPSVAITHSGSWSYIFGNIDADTDAASVLEGARLLAASADGLMPWKGRPDCLKRGLIARLPSPDFNGEPV